MIHLNIVQTQNLKISPQLQFSNKILQCSSLALMEEVQKHFSENPFLEEKINSSKILHSEKEYKIENINYDFNLFKKKNNNNFSKKSLAFQNNISQKPSLMDDLNKQLLLFDLTQNEHHIAQSIISSLDRKGYFIENLIHWATEKNYDFELSFKILKLIQSLEPKGIAGRNLKEVLLLQIDLAHKDGHLIRQLIKNHLHEISFKKNIKNLAKKYSVSKLAIEKSIETISKLNPIPASQYEQSSFLNSYIIPDLKIIKKNNQFQIILFEPYHSIQLNQDYWNILKNIPTNSFLNDKNLLKEQFMNAKLILYSLKKRKSTIIQVVRHLISYQRNFFEKGPDFLKPLSLQNMADKLNLHPSTISRVILHKYIETEWGIFSFRFFFERAISKKNGGEKSISLVKKMIQNIITSHRGPKHLSDQKISDLLNAKQIKIARRTVSKYRKELGFQK